LHSGFRICAAGHHDYRQVSGFAIAANLGEHRNPRQIRHDHIEQCQIKPARSDEIKRLGTIVTQRHREDLHRRGDTGT